MDVSKEYIQMCDCPEIQGMWGEPVIGDMVTFIYGESKKYYHGIVMPHSSSEKIEAYFAEYTHKVYQVTAKFWRNAEARKKLIWLPRQDQLQEMVKFQNIYTMLFNFAKFMDKLEGHIFMTMEQLWLAFVMKERFNKTWQDGQWKEGE